MHAHVFRRVQRVVSRLCRKLDVCSSFDGTSMALGSSPAAAGSSDFLSCTFAGSLRRLPGLLDVFLEVHIKYKMASEAATMIPTAIANKTFCSGRQFLKEVCCVV